MALLNASLTADYDGVAAVDNEEQTIAADGDYSVTFSRNSGRFLRLEVWHKNNAALSFARIFIFRDFGTEIFTWKANDEVYFKVSGFDTGDDVGFNLKP